MLELRDVSFRVDDEKDNEKDILEHVSFTLEDNKFVAITGPNPVFRRSTRKFPAFLFSLFSFLFPPLDFSLIYNRFLMPFRGFFYWKNFFDML